MGDLSFQNNVPDPLLAEKELPTFKERNRGEKFSGTVLEKK
jgi:hypothetical protein